MAGNPLTNRKIEHAIWIRRAVATPRRCHDGRGVGPARRGCGACRAPECGTTLKLWNDKPNWAAYFNPEGQSALKATGVGWKAVPYADTTTYQAAVRTAGRTAKAPDLFTWWSGYQMLDTVNASLAADLSPLWDKNKSRL